MKKSIRRYRKFESLMSEQQFHEYIERLRSKLKEVNNGTIGAVGAARLAAARHVKYMTVLENPNNP